MDLNELQKSCKKMLARVEYPRIATIIGLQEEIGKLSGALMDLEIYNKPVSEIDLEKKCSELLFSLIDLCNSYNISLDKISNNRIREISNNIKKWEKRHGAILELKRKKLD